MRNVYDCVDAFGKLLDKEYHLVPGRKTYMETEVQELAEHTAQKLKELTENEFARLVFLPAEEME